VVKVNTKKKNEGHVSFRENNRSKGVVAKLVKLANEKGHSLNNFIGLIFVDYLNKK